MALDDYDPRIHDDYCEMDDSCGCTDRANERTLWEMEHTDLVAEPDHFWVTP